jgi:hypothetical protein
LETLMRIGALVLADYPRDVIRIECELCARAGRYRLEGLIERYGPDMGLPELLDVLAKCERKGDLSRRCGARYPDLLASRPPLTSP